MSMLRRSVGCLLGVIIVGLSLPRGAWAQEGGSSFADRAQWQSGIFLEFIPVKYTSSSQPFFRTAPLLYGIHFGFHYELAQKNEQLSLGVEPGINFSFQYDNFFGTTFLAQVPVFLVGRIGARATKYNESLLGLGLGVGANYTYIVLPYTDQNKLSQGFVAPAAMVEISANPRRQEKGAFTLRFHINVVPYESDFDEVIAGNRTREKLSYENYGIGLIYQF